MSWDQLLSILKSNTQDQGKLKNEPPTSCPNDGTPLLTGPDGILFCPFDGWKYN